MVNPHVSQVNLKGDDSVDVVVEIAHIDTGHWADVSGYVIQEATAQGTEIQAINIFAPFSATLVVPDPPAGGGDPTVTVNVPGLNLNPAADVKVVVRVTEAMIWPTTLKIGQAAHLSNVTATWEALDDNPPSAGGPNPWSGVR
jgi:hypothetical protein